MLPSDQMIFHQTLEGHTNDVTWCDMSGAYLASCSNDKTVRLYRRNKDGWFEECSISPLQGHKYGVNCVRFSPFGTILASCSIDGMAILWNVQTGDQIAQLQHPSELAIRIFCFSPSSAVMATGGDDESIVLWDLSTRAIIRSLNSHDSMITACAFTPDSSFLVSGCSGGELKLWDARYGHGKCLFTMEEAHDLGVLGCDFSSQYESTHGTLSLNNIYMFASCGNDDMVKVWKVQTGVRCSLTLCLTLEGHTANVMNCCFSKDGAILVSVSGDKSVIIWDPYNGHQIQTLDQHNRYVTCCAFSSDNHLLATGSNDKTVIVWKINDGTCIEQAREEIEETAAEGTLIDESFTLNLFSMFGSGVNTASQWSVDDVCSWLDKLGVSQYDDIFRSNAIDGQELLHLTHESLNNNLKIEAMGHRNKILRGIQALKNPLWQNLAFSDDDGKLPDEFYCPITHELMQNPVVAADGYSYEKTAITEWMESGKDSSPMTNEQLDHTYIIPNRVLHLLIQKYLP